MMETEEEKDNSSDEKKSLGLGSGVFVALAKLLPAGMVATLGGPITAGMVLAGTAGVAIGVPALFLGAQRIFAPAAKGKAKLSDKLFGNFQSAVESVLPADAIRAASLEEEEAHPDDETSLGLLIPEEVLKEQQDKEKQAKGGKDKDKDKKEKTVAGLSLQGYGDKAPGKEDLDAAKSRFGGGLSGLPSGGGSGGGSLSGSGKQYPSASDSVSYNAQGGGAASGRMGRGQQTSTRRISAIRASKATGSEGLKQAAQLAGQAYGVGQVAKGVSSGAFGETPKSAEIVGGGEGGLEGGITSDMGVPDITVPNPGTGGGVAVPTPNAPTEEEEESDFPWGAVLGYLGVLAGCLLAAFAIAKLRAFSSTPANLAIVGVLTAIALAGLIAMTAYATYELFSRGDAGSIILGAIFIAASSYVAAMLIQAAATGSFDFNVFKWGASEGGSSEISQGAQELVGDAAKQGTEMVKNAASSAGKKTPGPGGSNSGGMSQEEANKMAEEAKKKGKGGSGNPTAN